LVYGRVSISIDPIRHVHRRAIWPMSSQGRSVHYSPTSLSVPNLRASVAGRVFTPEDAGYDEARTVFLGGIDRRPAAIVRVANTSDVTRVIAIAAESGVPLAVRSGGHSGAGHCTTDGGIVLDLHDMKALDVDPDRRTAWAETGLTAAEYSAGIGAHGLATGFGDTGSVGIGGITLAGGIGYLTRKYGLTIDSVLGAEVVTADGRLLQVDATSHPDLFWAIRGGGGNFGVVTRFHYRVHPVDQVVGGLLLLPASADVIVSIVEAAESAPEELSAIVNVMPAPPMPFVPESPHGRLVSMILLCYAGEADAGARALAPFRSIAEPIADLVRPMPYPEIFPPEDS
jgi:FAD/FMN-containing dehydrogenase